ncbi:energy transducer TonB [Thermodesulfobacteriota bacterium]
MKRETYARAYPLETGVGSRTMVLYFGISLAIHLIFFGSVVFWPASAPKPRFFPGSINVNLVSLPGPPSAAPAAVSKPPAQPVAAPKKEVKTAPIEEVVAIPPPKTLPEIKIPKKTVSLTPAPKKIKPKKSLKKKTQDRQKMIDHAVTKVKKKVEKSETDSVTQALDRLKKKVEQTESSGVQAGSTGQAAAGAGGGVPGATRSGGQRRLEIIDLYKIEVAFQVERNWAFSQQLAGDGQTLQVSLVFKVTPGGEITDIRFTERSGNSYLDESAYRAIVKANPVPPHPAGIRTPYVTMGVRFTPEGIKN